ncbi:hypothetical protein Dd586_0838 [Dickeya parazeae Ech586]|uniref:Uncharacterized protein n=1 Tax=Dickeya zeae (strain Ech586) TaxID=590409 RepID=D2BT89_DICZ5|nr:hypothetical protein Dd586_0838 [Dickeya parazeae Ech586]
MLFLLFAFVISMSFLIYAENISLVKMNKNDVAQ